MAVVIPWGEGVYVRYSGSLAIQVGQPPEYWPGWKVVDYLSEG